MAADDAPSPSGPAAAALSAAAPIRLDKWLWHARFAKSRAIAARLATEGAMRLNGARVAKPSAAVKPGDVLTFALGRHVRVVRVRAPGRRRGPAPEARELYDDLAPPPPGAAGPPAADAPPAPREPGAGRPSKAERRALDRLRRGAGD